MTEEDFDWTEFQRHIDGLRALSCAVVALTPMDAQSAIGTDESDDYLVTVDQAAEWLASHADRVEEAVLGDYWGDTLSIVYDQSQLDGGG